MAIQDEIKRAELKPTSTSSHEVADKVDSHVHLKLIPKPSNSSRDPLNWPMWKKVGTLAIVSYSAFVGAAQAACNASDQVVHARSYPGTTPIDESHTISAAIVGLAVGPVFYLYLIPRVGGPSCILWGTIIALGCSVWSALMTGPHDYVAYALSRWVGGMFGSAGTVVGGGTILELFFLHQRGWAFAVFGVSVLFAVSFAQTVSGYIVEFAPWPVEFWWTVGAEGSLIMLVLFLLPNTAWSRTGDDNQVQRSYWNERAAMFLPGTAIVTTTEQDKDLRAPIFILFSPVTLIAGFFLLVGFGWFVGVTTLLAVYLQEPINQGGYGVSPLETANVSLTLWVGAALAELYCFVAQDRLPIWLCRRRGGIWCPEYRLATLPLPVACECIGLGIFGAALQYHLPLPVLGFGGVLIFFAADAYVPIVDNYLVESFTSHPVQAATALNFWRLILGLLVGFFIDPWLAKVNVGWVFGTMAFTTLFAYAVILLLVFRGEYIRSLSFGGLAKSEQGEKLNVDSEEDGESA